MRFKYGKYTPSPLDDLDMDELMSKLSDLLLSSGFNDPYFSGSEDERSMQALYDAILEALLSGGVLPEETMKQLLGDQADAEAQQRLEQLIQQIMERMQENGYITSPPDTRAERERREGPGGMGEGEQRPTRFEVTDKAIDFLGYRALRDLLG
jgi:Ca-activated chloride channel family protein